MNREAAMNGFVQEMTRLGTEIGESTRERAQSTARRAQDVQSSLMKATAERQKREQDNARARQRDAECLRKEVQRMRTETHRMLEATNTALKNSLVQFVHANRSSVWGSLNRLKAELREAARCFRAGLAQSAKPFDKARTPDHDEDKRGSGKRGMRSKQ